MDKIWLNNYPAGVPAEINPNEIASLQALVERSFAKFADRPAYTCMDRTLTYGDLDRLSRQFAAYLQKVAGLQKGDRIAVMLPNILQYPVAIAAAFRAGLTIVNTNPLYTPRELEHQLKDSGARAILILENFAHTLQQVVHETSVETVIVTGVGDLLGFPKSVLVNFALRHVKKQVPEYSLPGAVGFVEALSKGKYENLEPVVLGHDDIAFLQYTGGTTGVSKGAMLTHRNLVANMQQAGVWVGTGLDYGNEVIITALPLYHIFALTANCLVFMKLGGLNHLITNPRDMPGFVKELKATRFTAITGVNTLFWLTRKAAEILGPAFDLEVVEMHHRLKKDAPSGTATTLLEILADVRKLQLEEALRHGRQGITGERTQNEIGIHAIRGGDVVGDHTVIFANNGERVELTHKASSRDTFANGALRAAQWVVQQKAGLYDMQDVLGLK